MAANMYSELRDEARDHARLRNAYFEQVCPTHHQQSIAIHAVSLALTKAQLTLVNPHPMAHLQIS